MFGASGGRPAARRPSAGPRRLPSGAPLLPVREPGTPKPEIYPRRAVPSFKSLNRASFLPSSSPGAQIPARDRDAMVAATVHLANRDWAQLCEDFVELGFLPPDCDRRVILPVMERCVFL